MTVSVAHVGRRRVPGAFLPATRSNSATRCQTVSTKNLRLIRPAASGGFHPDSVGASASTDATAPPSLVAPATKAPSPHYLLPYFASFFGHLHHHASSIAQHLGSAERASFFHALGLNVGPRISIPGQDGGTDSHAADVGRTSGRLAFPPWQLPPTTKHHLTSPPLPTTTAEEQQQQEQEDTQQQHHADDGHLWVGPVVTTHLPWTSAGSSPGSDTREAVGATYAGPTASASATGAPSPPQPAGVGAAVEESHHIVASPAAGLAVLWHSAVSLQQRALVTALWRMGQAAEAAEKARRSMPPPAEVPGLVHWGAVAAAARAEEAVALALAHTATAASAAAVGVPAATAAVTGSAAAAAAAAAVAAPHLPLLRHARRRVLAAAVPTLERLHGLQRGCTTHVLLRFLLFSSLSPRLRRDLQVRLDVLARRAAQLALLQQQHDTWLARQLPGGATLTAPPAPFEGRSPAASLDAHSLSQLPSSSSSAAASAASSGGTSHTAALSARWYGRVFAPEMLACARQLRLASPGFPPDDRTAGDPPGRFDLRDLYRLIRVIEVAMEDLERYE